MAITTISIIIALWLSFAGGFLSGFFIKRFIERHATTLRSNIVDKSLPDNITKHFKDKTAERTSKNKNYNPIKPREWGNNL